MTTAFLLGLLATAHARTLAGVTLPDTATVGGAPVVLNGVGLREKFTIDVYVGGLYLPAPTTDARKAVQDDVPKRLVMHFIYDSIERAKLVESIEEGLANVPGSSTQRAAFDRLTALMPSVRQGDEIVFYYVPGEGTTVRLNGASKGTVEGVDFMRVLFAIYLGDKPPTASLKDGLLGRG